MRTQIGLLHVRRSILIQASPARVWQEFESTERIKGWLNLGHTIHTFEPREGGQVEMSVDIDGEQAYFGGRILVYEPRHELTFDTQWRGERASAVPNYWTVRLTPMYDGTMVEIFHHGFERLGAEAADNLQGYEDGWDIKHLKALRAIVDA